MKTNSTRHVAGIMAFAPYNADLAIDGDEKTTGLMVAIVRSSGPDGKWSLPKGAIDIDETFEVAAIREFKEETGVTLGRTALLLDTKNRYMREGRTARHIIDYCFAYIDNPEQLLPNEHDVSEAAWVSLDGLLRMISHPEAKEAIKAHLQQYGLLVDEPVLHHKIHGIKPSGHGHHSHHHKKH